MKQPLPISIIIDTDIGDDVDDALALSLDVQSPELDLLGVTTVFRDALRRAMLTKELFGLLGREDIPKALECHLSRSECRRAIAALVGDTK